MKGAFVIAGMMSRIMLAFSVHAQIWKDKKVWCEEYHKMSEKLENRTTPPTQFEKDQLQNLKMLCEGQQ